MNEAVLQWLLEAETPSIRARCLRELLDQDGQEAQDAQEQANRTPAVRRMLARLDGFLEQPLSLNVLRGYLTACAELGLPLEGTVEAAAGQALRCLEDTVCGQADCLMGCAEALTLRALVMLSRKPAPALSALLDAYSRAIKMDGGFICERLLLQRPSRKSCYKASLAALLLYAACAERGLRLPGEEALVGYFTRRDLFYASDRETLILDGRAGWRGIDNFFPPEPMRMGLAQALAAMARLGAGNAPSLDRAWALGVGKRDANGRFALEGTLTNPPYNFGKVGRENKWVTLYMLVADKYRVSQRPN